VTSAPVVWFSRVLWLGIAANLALAIPTLVSPEAMLAAVGMPVPSVIMWTRFAALLLILLSVFYMPAAIDAVRYRTVAVLAVASRLAGVIFFFLIHRDYWIFGAFDLAFFVPEAILLMRIRHFEYPARP
jgi:hypothetical protein